ncbi:U3 snoRNP protein [Chamberlinius hualienensis]
MKTKPLSHKSQNTFKFQTFSEQLAQINVNIIRLIGVTSENPDDSETFFHETLKKWDELNCTEYYGHFKEDLDVDFQTLPQLVLNKEIIIECLKKHLNVEGSLAYSPLLELVVALSRDLQKDFYPYFYDFFEIFVKLLLNKSAEVIEHVFRSIAYLFKFLCRYMVNDFKKIYNLYSGLLDDVHPTFIKAFAAESIAYLLRKIPNKEHMLKIIFSSVRKNSELCEGVGLLLFECVKNVRHQFHSCCENILYLVLTNLGCSMSLSKVLEWDEILRCESTMITAMMHYTTPEFSSVVFKTFCKTLKDLFDIYKLSSEETRQQVSEHIGRVLQVLHIAVSWQSGRFLSWRNEFEEMLLNSLNYDDLSFLRECGQHLAKIAVEIILSPHLDLSSSHKTTIMKAIYNSKLVWDVKWETTKSMLSYSCFNEVVLPLYFSLCDTLIGQSKYERKEEVLSSMAELIIHLFPPPLAGSDFLKFKQEFDSRNASKFGPYTLFFLENNLKLQDNVDFGKYIPVVWTSVICAAYSRSSFSSLLETHLRDLCSNLVKRIISNAEIKEDEIFLLFYTFLTMLLTTEADEVEERISITDIENLLKSHSSNVFCLRMVDLYITFMKNHNVKDCYSDLVLSAVFPCLELNLSSPYEELRKISLRILTNFTYEMPPIASDIEKKPNVFEICLQVENVQLAFHDYRERLRLLQLLDYQHLRPCIPVSGSFETVPLRYLIGTFSVPFEPFWEPAIELISSYAQEMDSKQFWKVYLHYLQEAAEIAEKSLVENVIASTSVKTKEEVRRLFNECKEKFGNLPARIDYINQRKLLWKAMQRFTNICENKNRDLSTLFLNFIRNEFYRVEEGSSQDVSCSNLKLSEGEASLVESDLDDNENDDQMSLPDEDKAVKSSKYTTLILCSHLSIFSKFTNPKFIYREPELRKLYFDLLAHPSPGLQKLSLDCIMSYKYEFLKPYKENFYRLLDDRHFKTELVAFNIDSDVSVVLEEHRLNLIPYLMRILYGIMQKKPKKKHAGKASFHSKRRAIFQYLAKSREDEFKIFLDLIFDPIRPFIEGDILNLVESSLDFENVIPLRNLERYLRLLETVFKEFGGRISSHLSWLFKILICLTDRISVLIENRNKVHSNYWKHLRTLRKLSMLRIIQFFVIFDNYQFTREEIDALFIACVWPQLKRLPQDSIRVRSNLLLLFSNWSENPRYFPLLAKHHKECQTLSPLHQMVELLENQTTDKFVVTTILEIVKNLLSMANYSSEDDPSCALINVNEEFPVSEYACKYKDRQEKPNYGSIILLPHILPILKRLELTICAMGTGSIKGFPEANLTILNRLSEFVNDGSLCATLVKMLITFLARRLKRDEETELNLFSTIVHLLKVSDNPVQFVVPLAGLFSSLENRGSRVALCKVFDVISGRDESYLNCSSLANKLNAWNPRRLEEPDYMLRLDGFKEAQDIQSIDPSNPGLLFIVIYNCFYSIRSVNDLGIRDNASYCLQSLAPKFNLVNEADVSTVSKLFLVPLLNEIKKGLRNINENVRHEFISILAVLARECTKYAQFNNLRLLTSSEVDVDFFENIKHIQMHRRSRAMSRLTHGDLLQQLNQTTIIQYILPMTSIFLFNEIYQKHNYIVDASIELIGRICHHLEWNSYHKLLSNYLLKITDNADFLKMAITTVVKILDSFHFDLSVLGSVHLDKLVEPPVKTPIKTKNEDGDSKDDDDADEDTMKDKKEVNEDIGKMSLENATRIYNTITKTILPQLQRCLTRKSARDDVHHLAQRSHSDDDETLRVPVATAMIKLLQRLPKGTLNIHLPGILMKLCVFLKSRHQGIRNVARSTLVNIMDSLGAKYLPFVIKEMRQLLTRGYQVHSMTYTMHALLRHMAPQFKPCSLNHSIKSLIEIFREELFGVVSEEKEVQQIVGKLVEAKGTKAYDAYEIMAQFISSSHLNDLISCLKEILNETTNHKVVGKVKECFRRIVPGLVQNKALSSKDFLIFAHCIIQEGLESAKKINQASILADESEVASTPSIFIVPAEPRRNKISASKSSRTNVHVLSAFGLEVLYAGLKRDKIETTSLEALEMLDPFVDLVTEHMSSPHVELVTSSLKILPWLLDLNLPSLNKLADNITKTLFTILKAYTRSSNRQGYNSCDVIGSCFKALSSLIRVGKNSKIKADHMKMLLIYIEKDIHDSAKQASAFDMLKAILSKKLFITEVTELLTRIRDLSIISENEHVRKNCRQCVLKYLLNYPLGDKIHVHVQFFSSQLKYEHESGRESAMEMLNSIFTTFRKDILDINACPIFVSLGLTIIKDQSVSCRRMAAEVMKTLLLHVSNSVKNTLFTITETWITTRKLGVTQIGFQVCGIFVDLEKEEFQRRLPSVLPKLVAEVQLKNSEEINIDHEKFDHLLIRKLRTLLKILNETDIIRSSTHRDDLEKLWEFTQTLLLHPHAWVRCISSQLFGMFFGAYPVDDAVGIIASNKQNKGFFFQDFTNCLALLVNAFCKQLQSAAKVPDIKNQVAKNMIYLATIVIKLPGKVLRLPVTSNRKRKLQDGDDGETIESIALSIIWFIKKFLKEVKDEIACEARVTCRRTCFFLWVAAMTRILEKDKLMSCLNLILPSLLREITVDARFIDEELKNLAQEVIDGIKETVGIETFNYHYAQVQQSVSEKKSRRKIASSSLAVVNPQLAARRKMKKNLIKNESKKRKIKAFNKGRVNKRQKKM